MTEPGVVQESKLKRFVLNNGFTALAALTSAGLMAFMWFVKFMIPFVSGQYGERSILRMDLYHQYAPLFAELYQRLTEGGSLLYSWYSGLGGGFLGNYFNYLSSPTGFLVLLFGHERVPESIAIMVLVKCAFAAGAFAYMLRKMFGKNDAAIAAFGVLYSFCGWMIAYYWNVMWIDAMALLPLVALGIHYCVHKHKFMLYAVTLAITLVSNYYMGFMACAFSVLFFLVEYFSHYQVDAMLPDTETKSFKRSKLPRSALAFASGSLLAAALAAFALVPVYFALRNSSATGAAAPGGISTYFTIFDFLANHFADLNPTIRSSGDVVLPNIYSGVITLILTPLFLFVPSIKARDKIAHALLLAFLFFSFNVNILNFYWHAAKFPNDLPYRFSFMYSFILLLLAYRAFRHLREVPGKIMLGLGGLVIIFVVLVERLGQYNLLTSVPHPDPPAGRTGNTIYITLVFLAVYALLCAAKMKGAKRVGAGISLLLFCCVITEVSAATVKNFEITQVTRNFTVSLDDFQQLKSELLEDDPSFFRMELTDLRTRMDPAWYGYRGVSTFSSMAYERTANLQSRLGLGSNFINSYTYNPNTPVYNAMHNLKYLVENQNHNTPGLTGSSFLPVLDNSMVYTRRDEFTHGRFTVFENKYPLSVAFWVHNNVQLWDAIHQNNPFLMQQEFWDRASNSGDVFVPLDMYIDYDNLHYDINPSVSPDGYVSYSGKAAGTQVRIPLLLYTEEEQQAYIFVDWNHNSNIFVIRPDGSGENRNHDKQAIWDIGIIHPDEPLRVEIWLDGGSAPASGGFQVHAYGLDLPAFLESYERLERGILRDIEHSDTLLRGNLTAPMDGIMFTSIPYDEGWQVRINGQRVAVYDYIGIGAPEEEPSAWRLRLSSLVGRLPGGWTNYLTARLEKPVRGGLLAIPLPAGEHVVELRYVPQGLDIGLMISGAALMLLAVLGLLNEWKRREKNKAIVAIPEAHEGLFSTEGLSPSDFSLDIPAEELEANLPEEPAAHLPPPSAEGTPDEAIEPEEEIDDGFVLNLPPKEAEIAAELTPAPPDPVISASINAMLQEMQARAEELRRKMQLPAEDDEGKGNGQSFRLVE